MIYGQEGYGFFDHWIKTPNLPLPALIRIILPYRRLVQVKKRKKLIWPEKGTLKRILSLFTFHLD